MIDPHCHLDDPLLLSQLRYLIKCANASGVDSIIIPSYGPNRWQRQHQLITKRSALNILGAFGWHPWALTPGLDIDQYRNYLMQGWCSYASQWGSKLKAIGEFGLDRTPKLKNISLELQQEVFKLHLHLANEQRLPVILHIIKADGAALDLLKELPPNYGGVIHGYSSHRQMVPLYMELGLALSFGPALLRTPKVQESLKATPLEQITFETDAPQAIIKADFHPPYGPHHLKKIVGAASQLIGKSVEYLLDLHFENCTRIFNLRSGAQ